MKKKKYVNKKIHKRICEQYSDGLRQTVLSANLPSEAVMNESLITLIGHTEVWLENYKALVNYETDKILIQAKNYLICVEGTGLMISHYMEEHMMIRGNISKITYL